MRKLLLVVAALAMVVSFLPKAEAQDAGGTAELGVAVTFNYPPYWVIEPFDATVVAGEALRIDVLAEDPDGDMLGHGCRWWLNGERQPYGIFPEGADFHPKGDGVHQQIPYLEWSIPVDISLQDVHEFEFSAWELVGEGGINDRNQLGISKKIKVTILPLPVMAIELLGENPWMLGDVELGGAIKRNVDDWGNVIHKIANVGDVDVGLRVEYMAHVLDEVIHPGLERGENTFITLVGESVLPPNAGLKMLGGPLPPGDTAPLPLGYGSPITVSPKDSIGHEYGLQFIASEPIIDTP